MQEHYGNIIAVAVTTIADRCQCNRVSFKAEASLSLRDDAVA